MPSCSQPTPLKDWLPWAVRPWPLKAPEKAWAVSACPEQLLPLNMILSMRKAKRSMSQAAGVTELMMIWGMPTPFLKTPDDQ